MVNFTDVKAEGLIDHARELFEADRGRPPQLLMELVFWRQQHLMDLYRPIESRCVHKDYSAIDIHDATSQSFLKERAWWVTEELIEAQWGHYENNLEKTIEEIADALHFMTEILIVSGVKFSYEPEFPRYWPEWGVRNKSPLTESFAFRHFIMAILEELGMGMWQLRNKAWKQTQVLTDVDQFKTCIARAHTGIFELLEYLSQSETFEYPDYAVTTYLRKSEVNLWRIRSGY